MTFWIDFVSNIATVMVVCSLFSILYFVFLRPRDECPACGALLPRVGRFKTGGKEMEWVCPNCKRAWDGKGLRKRKAVSGKQSRDPDYIFCPHCGLEQWKEYVVCQKCGAHIADNPK